MVLVTKWLHEDAYLAADPRRVVHLSPTQLTMLLDGLDWTRASPKLVETTVCCRMNVKDFAGAYRECMYLLFMAFVPNSPDRPAALNRDGAPLDAENEKLRVLMRTLNDMIFGKRSERLAAIVAEQLALELDDLATVFTPPLPANDDTPANQAARPSKKARRNIGRTAQALCAAANR